MKTPFADQTSDGPTDLNLQNVCDLLRRFFLIAGFVFFAALAPSFPATADTDPTALSGAVAPNDRAVISMRW